MQLEIYSPTQAQPLPPVEWNYEAVKQWVSDGLAAYQGRVYTEDTLAEAKRDRANLNKLAKAIQDKRREIKKLYLAPYLSFEEQALELVSLVEAQSREIDAQIKTYDRQRREEKLEKIKTELYAPLIGGLAALVPYERLHDPKWLNVTVSMTAISEALASKIERAKQALAAPEENQEHTPPADESAAAAPEAQPMQLDFRVWVTHAQMMALREFLRSNNIKYGKVPRK